MSPDRSYPEGPTSVRYVTDPEETLAMEEHKCFVPGGNYVQTRATWTSVILLKHQSVTPDKRSLNFVRISARYQTALRLPSTHWRSVRWEPICHPIPWHSDHSRRCNIEMGRLDAAMVARGLPELGRSSVRPMSFSHLLRLIVDGWTPSCRATLSARLPACSIPIARPHCTAVSRGMAKSILIFLNFRMSVTVCWHDLYIMKENSDMDTAKTISQYMYMQYDLTIFFFFLGGQYIFRSTCVRRPLFLLMWVEEKILLPHRESNPGRRRERPES